MKCPSCGTKNPPKNKFCKECGEELAQAAAPAAARPQTTIIIKERERRGLPWFIWLLLGVILLMLLCCLLLWLRVVPVPCYQLARLPAPVVDWIDPFLLNMGVDCFEREGLQNGQAPGIIVNPGPGDDDGEEPDQPNRPQPQNPPDDDILCIEDLGETFSSASGYAQEFSKYTYIDFEFWEEPLNDQYLVYILEGYYDTPEPWMVEFAQNNLCNEGSWYDDGMSHLCQDTPLEFKQGMNTFVFWDFERECIAGLIHYDCACDSGQYLYEVPGFNDCCTVGCMCTLPGGGNGCWQTCAPQCVD